jgi:hypothetical protein
MGVKLVIYKNYTELQQHGQQNIKNTDLFNELYCPPSHACCVSVDCPEAPHKNISSTTQQRFVKVFV